MTGMGLNVNQENTETSHLNQNPFRQSSVSVGCSNISSSEQFGEKSGAGSKSCDTLICGGASGPVPITLAQFGGNGTTLCNGQHAISSNQSTNISQKAHSRYSTLPKIGGSSLNVRPRLNSSDSPKLTHRGSYRDRDNTGALDPSSTHATTTTTTATNAYLNPSTPPPYTTTTSTSASPTAVRSSTNTPTATRSDIRSNNNPASSANSQQQGSSSSSSNNSCGVKSKPVSDPCNRSIDFNRQISAPIENRSSSSSVNNINPSQVNYFPSSIISSSYTNSLTRNKKHRSLKLTGSM
uniref:Uncharacterized protein n=1 Tax=Phlebotomus papatasi TaxID=29031 RepID=A0A1B0CZM6_PHLPP